MIIAGMLMGGATRPNTAPIAMKPTIFFLGRPIFSSTVATRLPAAMIAAVPEPVSAAGSIITNINKMRSKEGDHENQRIRSLTKTLSPPDLLQSLIKMEAVMITITTSKYMKPPSIKCRSAIP